MASRVLLISVNRYAKPDPVFPLGLSHLQAALRQAGHECMWLDALADADHFQEKLQNARADVAGISLRNIDDVLIRQKETFFEGLASLGATVRQALNCPVVVGGSGFSIFPKQLFELSGADYGVAGEGEAPFLELIEALETGGDCRRIPGLVFRQDGKVIENLPHPGGAAIALEDSDRPAAIAAYYVRTGSMLNLQTQRGCSFRCCYCTYPVVEGRRHRRRPPEIVAEEFEQLRRLGARYAFIVDSVFNTTPRHVTEICEAVLSRGVELAWGCFLRPQGLTSELMRLMKRAGLKHIEFGSDSLCDEVLTAYHKDFTLEEIARSSSLAREEKIDYCHFLIAGGPGETRETLERTFQNSLKLEGGYMVPVVGMRIYPGTALFRQAIAEGRLGENADLLKPTYYLAPGLTVDGVFSQLEDFSRRSPSWIPEEPIPGFEKLVARQRKRGVAGPLWSYSAELQRRARRAAWMTPPSLATTGGERNGP